MNSPSHKPLSKKNTLTLVSPPEMLRKTSIISNLMAKANKQPNLKKLSILAKTETSSAKLNSPDKNANAGKIAKSSMFHQNANVQFKQFAEEGKNIHSSFKKTDKDKTLLTEDPDVILIDISKLLKKVLYKICIICKLYYIQSSFYIGEDLFVFTILFSL